MVDGHSPDSLWTKVSPDSVITRAELPERVKEFAFTIDGWINDHARYIDPFAWEESDERKWRKKMFLESAGYALSVRAPGREKPLPTVHEVIVRQVNDRQFAHKLLRSACNFHHFAVPVLYTKYVDELDSVTTAALERTVELGAFRETERLPMRNLEYWALSRYISSLFGWECDWFEVETILENSILNNQPNATRSSISDAYCLTHDLLFYNNFLDVCNETFPAEPAPYETNALLRGLILRYMAADNCDIVSELVLVGVMQRQLSRQMVQFALSWLVEKAEPNGFVPGPKRKKEQVLGKFSIDTPDIDEGRWDYATEEEAIWGSNYHTNIAAGMAAHFVCRDWKTLKSWQGEHDITNESFRRDVSRLGEMLNSLGEYDLERGARQMRELSDSPVRDEFGRVFEQAVDFLSNQQTRDGEFGYWTDEEVLYTNAGHSPKTFRTELVAPVSEACRKAIDAVENDM